MTGIDSSTHSHDDTTGTECLTRARRRSTAHLVVVLTTLLAATVLVVLPPSGAGSTTTLADRPAASPSYPTAGSGPAPNADTSGALAAARALADETPGAGVIPVSVVADLGYAPGTDLGLASNAAGDCSSPVQLPDRFEPACRIHDLGYDLLRVADRHGDEIPYGLRQDLDDLLARQMLDSCTELTLCRAAARVAHTAVHLNTVRQGHGAPIEEWFPW